MHKVIVTAVLVTKTVRRPEIAWGDRGHERIATIARDRLSAVAQVRLNAVLAKDTEQRIETAS